MGEYTFPEGYKPEIQVIVNPDEKTLKFIDNGIGMTADEVETVSYTHLAVLFWPYKHRLSSGS